MVCYHQRWDILMKICVECCAFMWITTLIHTHITLHFNRSKLWFFPLLISNQREITFVGMARHGEVDKKWWNWIDLARRWRKMRKLKTLAFHIYNTILFALNVYFSIAITRSKSFENENKDAFYLFASSSSSSSSSSYLAYHFPFQKITNDDEMGEYLCSEMTTTTTSNNFLLKTFF